MSKQPEDTNPLRSGFTTGTCATAASLAALKTLLSGITQEMVTVRLPKGEMQTFALSFCELEEGRAICMVQKDAGDDPDVTHGLEIGAQVRLNDLGEIRFLQGEGVGMVTMLGLEIPVGEPAINPVPRQMISEGIKGILHEFNATSGVDVTVFVPRGKEVAERTFNPKLGIIGGISIIGTTGIVKPYSSEAFVASICKEIDVAKANGVTHLILNSGGRSERFLKNRFPDYPEMAFVHFGNFIGATLEHCARVGMPKVTLGIMLGKAVKLAEGHLDTHSKKVLMNTSFLEKVAKETAVSKEKIQAIRELKMARNLVNHIPFAMQEPFYERIASLCLGNCQQLLPEGDMDVLLMNLEGEIIPFSES